MKYTYIVDISDIDKAWERIEKRTKREIKRCEEEIFLTTDVDWFNKLHKKTRPDRKIDEDFIETIFKKKKAIIYATQTAGSVISNDGKTGYYLFGARDKSMSDGCPSKILWQAMKDLNAKGVTKFDLCGANNKSIAFFKRGFGGKLVNQKKDYFK